MRIDRRGAWHYEGSPIGRPELVKLFADVLRRDAASDHWLITPAEACRIRVDDAPFVAVDCECRNPGPDQEIVLRTNVDAFVTVDADHPIRVEIDPQTAEPAPYVGLGNSLEAKIARPVFYELVDLGVRREQDGRSVIGVWSKSVFFELGDMGGDDE